MLILVKKSDLDDKLMNLNREFTLNKTKHVLVDNESNELLKKAKLISMKGLAKDFIIAQNIFLQ